MTKVHLLLLVEDDPTSRDFLRAALRTLPAEVDCASSIEEAVQSARARRHDLWLLDAHLPDGSGAALLARLRSSGSAVPALAHTAANDAALSQALLAQGFDEVVTKPVQAELLQAIVRRHLGLAAEATGAVPATRIADAGGPPVWDDDAACAALNGQAENVAALRGLFVAELAQQRDAVLQAAQVGDGAAMSAHLHRLRASCGFTGAALLAQATAALSATAQCPAALRDFDAAVDATLADAERFRIARTW
jgi:DNA-binding response OmpR family regulator